MRRARAALAVFVALALTGCVYPGGPMPQPGINTPFDGLSDKSKAQLLDETITRVDEIAQLIGGVFLDSGIPPAVFDPANDEQRSAWDWSSCDNEATTGQYVIDVLQRAAPSTKFDPDALAAKVRAHWESHGYKIRQIGPPEQDVTRGRSIVVDLPHSAGFSFWVSTHTLGISAQRECISWEE